MTSAEDCSMITDREIEALLDTEADEFSTGCLDAPID